MKLRQIFKNIILVLLGGAVFSVAVNGFAVPNGIVQGGLTGVATMLNHLFPRLPVGVAVFALNIPLFVASFFKIGKAFLAKTLAATAVFTLLIDLGALFIPGYKGDTLLSALFCGVLSGMGLGLVLLSGATTGGTEVVALLVRLRNPFVSVGRIMLLFDLVVIAFSWLVFGGLESVMYASVSLFVSSKTIDLVLYGNSRSKLMFIVTEQAQAVCEMIMTEIQRGVTCINATGAFSGKQKKLLLCAMRSNEAASFNQKIKQVDENAFTIITEASDVFGKGFRR